MREHKYKAKRLDGQWVEGYYWQNGCGNHFIRVIFECNRIVIQDYEINPDTLCEFTGLYDKNNHEIWENDILELYGRKCLITYGEWNCGCCCDVYGWIASYDNFRDEGNKSYGEVIGNIFDNPELLEVK